MTNYTLHHGDCLDILPTLPPSSVDAIIADPPYGTTACKWDSVIPFDAMWRELKRVIKPRGAIVLFGSQPFTSALVMSWPQGFKYEWVWDKEVGGNHFNAPDMPMKSHENICVFYQDKPIYNPQYRQALKQNMRYRVKRETVSIYGIEKAYTARNDETLRYPKTVLTYNGLEAELHKTKRLHPTQKPLALLEYLVRTYTNAADTVLDFTFGSGTTGEACINTGRDFIGIEKERNYYDIAAKRLSDAAARLIQMEIAI